jgi:NAD(P)-dependent dehydrogenase (short-subunit alcohol dehydrogenase family)
MHLGRVVRIGGVTMAGRLDRKIAIITGGGTGIGRATAGLFCREGARVVITGRRERLLDETAELIREEGGHVRVFAADVADPDACDEVVKATTDSFGPPTVLVNNAGIFEARTRIHEMTAEAWNRMIAVNLTGPFLMTRAVIPSMLAAGGGSIVNIGSILSEVAIPCAAAYSASKGGLLMLTRSTAMDYGPDQIRCNLVCPGMVRTVDPLQSGLPGDGANGHDRGRLEIPGGDRGDHARISDRSLRFPRGHRPRHPPLRLR